MRTSQLSARSTAALLQLICSCGLTACDPDLFSTDAADRDRAPAMYTVGGTVSGLTAGESVSLLDNNADALTVSANGVFAFKTELARNSTYAITVATQPSGQICTVAGGSGTVLSANIANAVVTCSDLSFTLGGSIQGLNGSGLVLANGSDTVAVPSGATTFTFPTPIAFTSSYTVAVQTQPSGSVCSVANGSGAMPAANVASVAITCTDQPFSLGGTIAGLGNNSGLILANGTDTLNVAANKNAFTMPGKVNFGSAYTVTVQAAPSGLTCTVTQGSGTMTPTGIETVIWSFGSGADGQYPYGSLLLGKNGFLYGLANSGGTGHGVVFQIN